MTVSDRLAEWGGCARRAQIATSTSARAELRSLVARGAVVRSSRGLYSLPGTPSDVVVARRVSGLLTCVSALDTLGLPLLAPPDALHLALPGHAPVPRADSIPRGTVLHWESGLVPAGRTQVQVRGPRSVLVPVPIALVHAVRCLPARDAIAVVDAALNRGLVTVPALAAQRPRAGKVEFDRRLRAADGRSQSIPETFARLALRDSGLLVEPQAQIAGVGRVDLLVERLVVVELDGFAYHGDRAQFREDRRRDRVLHLIGLPALRFTFEDTVREAERLVVEVTSMVRQLRRAGRRPLDPALQRGARGW